MSNMTPAKSKQALTTSRDRDPVQVYCRIRPLENSAEDSCVTVINDTTVQVVPPEASQGYRTGITKVFEKSICEAMICLNSLNVSFAGHTVYIHWCIQ